MTCIVDFLTRLYGDAPGTIALAHHDGRQFRGTSGFHDTPTAAAEHALALDARGGQGVYHRVTTLSERPDKGQRGGAEMSLALPGLWADVDFGSAGHKHDPAKHDGRPLPPDSLAAKQLVAESGLPAPSLWIHTGGGLYPWWLLDTPAVLGDEPTRATAQALSTRWQEVLFLSALAHGWDYGAGVGDLARVLRVPGTTNRKTGQDRPCRVLQDDGTVYTLTELFDAAQAAPRPQLSPVPAPVVRATMPRPVLAVVGDPSPFDALDGYVTFDDILTGAGWTLHRTSHSQSVEQCWTRPGDPDNPCSARTLTAQPHVLVVHSESAGLPTGGGQRITRGRLFAHLHHGGDEKAAARDLGAAINSRPCSTPAAHLPLPRNAPQVTPPNLGTLGVRAVELAHAQVAHDHHAAQLQQVPDGQHDEDQANDAAAAFHREVAEQVHYLQVREAAQQQHAQLKRGDRPSVFARNGAEFILDSASDTVPALWGRGTEIVLAEGEPLMIVGGPGVGKTTLAGQILEARLGIGNGTVLGMPVTPTSSRVLYLAMDRPRQIARALARLFTEDNRDTLSQRLVFWPGPPPADLAADTDALARLAHQHGADTIVVDSLKDAVLGLSEDGPAAAYNRARQAAIADGIELLELHHNRKNGGAGRGITTLADVYGSAWLTAGAGSVIALNGDPGDPVVEVHHLKQPSDTIGPLKVIHDNQSGRSTIYHSTDLLALARAHGDITAKDAARALFETDKPTPNDIEKARRRLDKLERDGRLTNVSAGDKTTNQPARWETVPDLVDTHHGPSRTPSRTPSGRDPITTTTGPSRQNTKAQVTGHHGDLHDHHAQGPSRPPTPLEGVGVGPRGPQDGFAAPTGNGRCDICAHHIDTQGHASACPQRSAS